MRIIQISILIISLVSCSSKPSELSLKEFVNYVNDEENGLKSIREINGINYSLTFIPITLRNYTLKGDLNNLNTSNDMFFSLKVSLKNNKDVMKLDTYLPGQYHYRLQYLNSEIQKDFSLINGQDTLKCSLANFEYFEGISSFVTINISIPQVSIKKMSEELVFVYNDKLWNSGSLKFLFYKEDLINLPTIK